MEEWARERQRGHDPRPDAGRELVLAAQLDLGVDVFIDPGPVRGDVRALSEPAVEVRGSDHPPVGAEDEAMAVWHLRRFGRLGLRLGRDFGHGRDCGLDDGGFHGGGARGVRRVRVRVAVAKGCPRLARGLFRDVLHVVAVVSVVVAVVVVEVLERVVGFVGWLVAGLAGLAGRLRVGPSREPEQCREQDRGQIRISSVKTHFSCFPEVHGLT